MDVCLIIANYWPGWGGAERQCALLARSLSRLGHEVTVLTRGGRGLPREDRIMGVSVRRTAAFGRGPLRSLVWTLSAAVWLRRHGRRFRILHCYQLLSPSHVGILGRRSKGQAAVLRPACSGPYGDVAEMRRLPLTGLRRRLLRRADAMVTLTREIEGELTAFGLGGVPFHRIPNGVDTAAFAPATAEERAGLRAELGLSPDGVVCAFVGRLTSQKNPGLLLEAWSRDEGPRAELVFVGDGPLRAELERRSLQLPPARRARFAGAAADVAPFLRAIDVLLLPSAAEGMSNAMLEAMACGVSVVAADLAGAREVLGEDGKTGWLAPPGDAAAWARAAAGLASSPGLRREMGGRAREAILERHEIGRVAERHASLYASLLG